MSREVEQPGSGSTRKCWTSELLPSHSRPVRELRRQDIKTLQLVTDYPRGKLSTVGGILLFGRDRARHFPDAWIQAGRFQRTDYFKAE